MRGTVTVLQVRLFGVEDDSKSHMGGVLGCIAAWRCDAVTPAVAVAGMGTAPRAAITLHGLGQHHGFAARPIGDIGPGWPGVGAPDIGPLTNTHGNRGTELPGSGLGETSYQAYDHAVTDIGR